MAFFEYFVGRFSFFIAKQLYRLVISIRTLDKTFGYQANIGDARSLIVNPAQTTHGELTHEQREVTGLSINTIRLSIGLEDPQDLIDDLDQAFVKAFE